MPDVGGGRGREVDREVAYGGVGEGLTWVDWATRGEKGQGSERFRAIFCEVASGEIETRGDAGSANAGGFARGAGKVG